MIAGDAAAMGRTVRVEPDGAKERPPGIVREALLKRAQLKLRSFLVLAVEDTETGVTLWTLRGTDKDGDPVSASAKDLEDAFREVLGMHEEKQCYTCLRTLRLLSFSRDKTRRDGLCQRCKECERIRKGWGDRRRGRLKMDDDDQDDAA